MSAVVVAIEVVGVLLVLTAGAAASPLDEAIERRGLRWRPAGHGVPASLWGRLVARELAHAGWRVVLLPVLLAVAVLAGLVRVVAGLALLADVGMGRSTEALDAATDTDPVQTRFTDLEDL